MGYIKKREALRRMKLAEEEFRPAIILAHAGWGKTALVEYYFRNRRYLLLSGESGALNKMPDIDRIRQGVVVVDGVTWIDDPESEEYVRQLIRDNSRQIILVGRGKFPGWLEPVAMDVNFEQITRRELELDRDDIPMLFEDEGITLSVDETNLLLEMTEGYPPALKFCLRHCVQGELIDRGRITRIRTELFHYYEEVFFRKIREEARQLLMTVSELEVFSPSIAEELSEGKNVHNIIDYCEKVGSFLTRVGPDTWEIIDDVREFLKWKKALLWSIEQRTENNRRIAAWYEKNDRLAEAAEYYEKVGDSQKILDLLVKNSHSHPGIGQYHALRKHYENLPEEMILQDPSLIAGESLLKSMTMKPEESEQWYRELEQYEKNVNYPPEKRKEAKALLSYLDIGLPHRAGKGMIGNMKSAVTLMTTTGMELPEFSVTDNIPSLINGGLDYSGWVRNADQIAYFMGSILEKILGRHGKGLVDVGVAEVGFECGTMEPHEVIRLANRGIAEAANTGSSEICFAGYGVVIRQNLAQGNLQLARDCLEQFRERVEREDDTQLIPNIKATDALIALYESDQDKVMKWIGETPDVHHNFSILDRYIYQIRLQCLIAIDSLPEAMNLASYMDWYYREYRRTYSRIENGILNGIIAYRQGHSDWSQILADALSAAEEYHYVQVAAMKGGALMPLLNEMETSQVPEKFLKEVKSRCREIALAYPDFMKRASRERPQLTPREEEILGMLCAGESMDKICETCGISYSGLKKHNRNIYAKLGAKNRAEAERAAVSMGLVRRGSSSD